MNKELNIFIIERIMQSPRPTEPPSDHNSFSTDKTRCWQWLEGSWEPLPFDESIELAFKMEGRIKELGMGKDYAVALLLQLGIVNSAYVGSGTVIMEAEEVFATAHASAHDRAKAAGKCLEGKS